MGRGARGVVKFYTLQLELVRTEGLGGKPWPCFNAAMNFAHPVPPWRGKLGSGGMDPSGITAMMAMAAEAPARPTIADGANFPPPLLFPFSPSCPIKKSRPVPCVVAAAARCIFRPGGLCTLSCCCKSIHPSSRYTFAWKYQERRKWGAPSQIEGGFRHRAVKSLIWAVEAVRVILLHSTTYTSLL